MEHAREVFFLIDASGEVFYREEGASAVHIADSRTRWEIIWESRDRIAEMAHSHPVGPLAFSEEDRTTMIAIDAALGRSVCYSVVAPTGMVRRQGAEESRVECEPSWAHDLRVASQMSAPERSE